jgi:2,4'-dihydroxyacetophenone dioxygenase
MPRSRGPTRSARASRPSAHAVAPLHTSIAAAQAEVIDAESVPWIPFEPHSSEVLVKYFRLDPLRGEIVMLLKAPVGATLPRMHQSGRIMIYTLEGRWKHHEEDWIAGPGSVVMEPAASSHTVAVIAGDAPLLVLVIVVGDVLFLGPRGEVRAIENWKTAQERYLAYCTRYSITPRDLTQSTIDRELP